MNILETVSDPTLQPWSQIGIVGVLAGFLVVVGRWMMSRLDKTIDALAAAVNEFRALSERQLQFQAELKELLSDHLDKVERLLERMEHGRRYVRPVEEDDDST